MRRFALLLIVGSLASLPAAAGTRELVLPSGERVVITEELCAALAADPNEAAYAPGIDVEGRPVAPADLPGDPSAAIGAPPVEILVDPRRFGAPAAGFVPRGSLGYVTVENGRALLNGRPLADGSAGRLAAVCRAGR
jgi:hypothetical protein